MSNVAAALIAAEDNFSVFAQEESLARAALRRSKSNANFARFAAAHEAFNTALAEITKLREAAEVEELMADVAAAASLKAAETIAEPAFAF